MTRPHVLDRALIDYLDGAQHLHISLIAPDLFAELKAAVDALGGNADCAPIVVAWTPYGLFAARDDRFAGFTVSATKEGRA